eukprot:562616-Amphidinium_carterae.1
MHNDYTDVRAKYLFYIINIVTTEFCIVAERVHRLRVGHQRLHHEVQQQAEHGLVPGYDPVYSALLVKPTFLDPTSMSTTTWFTSTRCSSDINMLTVPKQQPHRRELPSEATRSDIGPYDYIQKQYLNWAAEVQIHMSLEDHNLATLMENVKTQTVPINAAGYIDQKLHEQGFGHDDAEKTEDVLQRLLRLYTTRTEPIIRRNAERRQRRQAKETQMNQYHKLHKYPTHSNHLHHIKRKQ